MFPDSSAIYLIRDPRAVAGSLLSMPWSTHNIYTISRSWRAAVQNIGQIEPNILIRYEDIVAKDPSVLEKLTEMFDADLPAEQLYDVQTDTTGINPRYHSNLNKDIGEQFIDKWKNQLSRIDREVEIIERICQPMMAKYGYTPILGGKKSFVGTMLMAIDILKLMVLKVDFF